MRFFIALEIPEQNKQQLIDLQIELKQILPGLKLTTNNKFHLTYAFVGEQPDQMEDKLVQILEQSAKGIGPFFLTPAYLDGFPSLHHAKVIWVGVKGDIDKLFILREKIKDGLNSLHLDTDDRRFVPHISIGKMENFELDPKTENKLQEIMNRPFSPIAVTSVKLFESVPNEGFHSHNTLSEIKL